MKKNRSRGPKTFILHPSAFILLLATLPPQPSSITLHRTCLFGTRRRFRTTWKKRAAATEEPPGRPWPHHHAPERRRRAQLARAAPTEGRGHRGRRVGRGRGPLRHPGQLR